MVEFAKAKCAKLAPKKRVRSTARLLIAMLPLLMAVPVTSMGCQGAQLPSPSPLGEPPSTLVSDIHPDVYILARQDSPTRIPAWAVDPPEAIEVESLALWAIPSQDESALGMAVTLTSAGDASRLYDGIDFEELYAGISPERLYAATDLDELYTTLDLEKLYSAVDPKDVWKMASGNTVYLVYGSGTAAEPLKSDILEHDFKYHNYCESLEAVVNLPSDGATKPAAIAVVRPSGALMGFMAKYADPQYVRMINAMLKLGNIKLIEIGLYSPGQIDVAEMAESVGSGRTISNLDLGLLISVESGLPGFLVAPAVKKLLVDYEFVETRFDGFTLYERTWYTYDRQAIPLLVWVKGNHIFAAVARQGSYAQALISSAMANLDR